MADYKRSILIWKRVIVWKWKNAKKIFYTNSSQKNAREANINDETDKNKEKVKQSYKNQKAQYILVKRLIHQQNIIMNVCTSNNTVLNVFKKKLFLKSWIE